MLVTYLCSLTVIIIITSEVYLLMNILSPVPVSTF
jgi:hypothetical protein